MESARQPKAPKLLTAVIVAALIATGGVSSSHAHVRLLVPDGGEQLQGGQNFEITWEVVVDHQISGWDLWYSTNGPNGPWIDLYLNLPPGDSTIGSIHTYRWVVPLENSENVRVRVKQLTTFGTQWEDTSATELSIFGNCCVGIRGNMDGDPDERIDISDLVYLVDAMFCIGCQPVCALEADVNDDGALDISDLVYYVEYFFSGGVPPTACPQ